MTKKRTGVLLRETLQEIKALDENAMREAQARQEGLLKPPGSLGKLEDISVRLAGIYGESRPQIREKAIVMMAADNGVYAEGFNGYAQEFTGAIAEMTGPGLVGISVLARHAGSRLAVVDVGIKDEVAGEHIIPRKIRKGTANIAKGPAMSREEAEKALEVGIEIAAGLIKEGIGVLGMGEVGICNTTTAAAVASALTGENPENITGIGTGGDEKALALKIGAIKSALAVNNPDPQDPIDVLAKVGGLDIAGMAGCCLAAARYKVPIVVDGFIAGAAALAAVRMNPLVREYMLSSHVSAEKGGRFILDCLRMEPMLCMNMRLGEGTGAALAFNLIDAACRIINEMGSFDDLKKG